MSPPLSRPANPVRLSAAEFARIAEIARREAGLCLSDAKQTLIASRLAKRLRATGLPDFATYIAHLDGRTGAEERRKLISALTTNVTHFFRELHHFDTLETELSSRIVARARAGGVARIWSAGCSTGQEPYSIALTIRRLVSDAAPGTIRVLATDIDEAALAVAEHGRYPAPQLDAVPPADRRRFFRVVPDGHMEVNEDVRALVRFRRLNLVGEWPVRGPFDAIFCRNVVIYFDAVTQAALWPRFHEVLAPGGLLFIGHSERLDPTSAKGFVAAGVTTYRKRGSAGYDRTGGMHTWH